jgi:hypothetical protein
MQNVWYWFHHRRHYSSKKKSHPVFTLGDETLRDEEAVSEEAMRELIKEVTKLSELIKNVVPVYDFANPQEKEQIIKVIFSELYISHNTLQYKLKKGFETFYKRIDVLFESTWT